MFAEHPVKIFASVPHMPVSFHFLDLEGLGVSTEPLLAHMIHRQSILCADIIPRNLLRNLWNILTEQLFEVRFAEIDKYSVPMPLKTGSIHRLIEMFLADVIVFLCLVHGEEILLKLPLGETVEVPVPTVDKDILADTEFLQVVLAREIPHILCSHTG